MGGVVLERYWAVAAVVVIASDRLDDAEGRT